ncbi:MAG: GtrA family protein [Corynebacterium sp.]|nr:GtrA family protein [Corynebacterium sp.]
MMQFIKFGLVGGSGTVVNLIVVAISRNLFSWGWNISEHDAFMNLLGSAFHIRWYHVYMTIAFVVANIWNYQLNRYWTFRAAYRPKWFRGFFAFLATGIGAFIVSQMVATGLMNPNSPIALPSDIFDDSNLWRTKMYWASAISIIVAMPINFLINKLWAFRTPKPKVVIEQEPVKVSS